MHTPINGKWSEPFKASFHQFIGYNGSAFQRYMLMLASGEIPEILLYFSFIDSSDGSIRYGVDVRDSTHTYHLRFRLFGYRFWEKKTPTSEWQSGIRSDVLYLEVVDKIGSVIEYVRFERVQTPYPWDTHSL